MAVLFRIDQVQSHLPMRHMTQEAVTLFMGFTIVLGMVFHLRQYLAAFHASGGGKITKEKKKKTNEWKKHIIWCVLCACSTDIRA